MIRSLFISLCCAGLAFWSSFLARRHFFNDTSAVSNTSIKLPGAVSGKNHNENLANSAAWTAALQENDPILRMENLKSLLGEMKSGDFRSLAEQSIDDADVLSMIMRQWAKQSPRDAVEWSLRAMKSATVGEEVLGQVISIWAQNDSAAVIGWLHDPAHQSLRWQLTPLLVTAVFARDPAAALALAEQFPNDWTLPPTAEPWMKEHPAHVARALAKLPQSNWQNRQLWERVAAAWAEKDPAAAIAFAPKLDPYLRHELTNQSLAAWAKQDPAAAAAYYAKLPRGEADANGLAKSWAQKDPNAAIQWALLRHPFESGNLIGAILGAAGEKDISQACNLLTQIDDGPLRDNAAAGLMQTWAKQDPKAALTWASQQPAGPTRTAAVSQALNTWREKDLTAAAEFALAAPAGTVPPHAYTDIMYRLRQDPAAAYTWLNKLPDNMAEHTAKAFVQFARSESDVNAMRALPDGKYKNQLVNDATRNYFQAYPDQALTWALASSDASLRQSARQAVEAVEPTAAPTFFNGITADKKAVLLERLK
jgi:hypothetical protein